MPQPYTLTPEDIEHLVSQGYDANQLPKEVMVEDEPKTSALAAAGRAAGASVLPTIAGGLATAAGI